MEYRAIAKLLGQRGGRARARRLTADERRLIASLGGRARRESIEGAERIAASLRHARMVARLQSRPTVVRRVKRCTGPLPGLYRKRHVDD